MSEVEVLAIDRWAEYAGVTRSEMVRRLLSFAIARASQDDRIPSPHEGVVLIDRHIFEEMKATMDRHQTMRRKITDAVLESFESERRAASSTVVIASSVWEQTQQTIRTLNEFVARVREEEDQ